MNYDTALVINNTAQSNKQVGSSPAGESFRENRTWSMKVKAKPRESKTPDSPQRSPRHPRSCSVSASGWQSLSASP